MHHNYRSKTIGWTKHGSSCLCTGWRPEKVHIGEGVHKLSLLQWGKWNLEMHELQWLQNIIPVHHLTYQNILIIDFVTVSLFWQIWCKRGVLLQQQRGSEIFMPLSTIFFIYLMSFSEQGYEADASRTSENANAW